MLVGAHFHFVKQVVGFFRAAMAAEPTDERIEGNHSGRASAATHLTEEALSFKEEASITKTADEDGVCGGIWKGVGVRDVEEQGTGTVEVAGIAESLDQSVVAEGVR